jgi:hypothetical protein
MPRVARLFSLLFVFGMAGQDNGPSSKYTLYRGSYTNRDYGYEILLPDNLPAKGSVPPNPNHGVRIDLKGGGGSYIATDANYPEETLLQDVVRSEEGYAKEECEVLEEKAMKPSSLGGLPAARLAYRCASDGTLREEILAIRRVSKDTRIRYLIELVTRNHGDKLRWDESELLRVMDGFLLLELPSDDLH